LSTPHLEFHHSPNSSETTSFKDRTKKSHALAVDKKSTVFSLSTLHIDKFFTITLPVDNWLDNKVILVDKLRKSIAPLTII
jgi:hypothetical protein